MEIPNYDNKKKVNTFKTTNDFMPQQIFRLLLVGNSGSGKTNLLLHILRKPLIYYDKIYLYAKNLEQSKYQDYIEKMQQIADKAKCPLDEILEYSNDEIISISDLDNILQKVVIFDDYVCDKNQNDIINYFIQGRHKNCCVIYLTQSYYKTPKDIRLNCSHYIFFATPSKREQSLLCNEQGIDKTLFDRAMKKKYDFLYVDKPEKINKRNFTGDL